MTETLSLNGLCELIVMPNCLSIDAVAVQDLGQFFHPLSRMLFDPSFRAENPESLFSVSVTTDDKCTLVLDEACRKCFRSIENFTSLLSSSGSLWRAIRVELGMSGANLSKNDLIAQVSAFLAASHVPIYHCSTFSSEFFLVGECDFDRCLTALRVSAGLAISLPSKMEACGVWSLKTTALFPTGLSAVRKLRVHTPVFHCVSVPHHALAQATHSLLNALLFSPTNNNNNNSNNNNKAKLGNSQGHTWYSVVSTSYDLSLVLTQETMQSLPAPLQSNEGGWVAIEVDDGELGFSSCGIVSRITASLKKLDLPLLYVSVYATDYCLVPIEEEEAAKCVLVEDGFDVHSFDWGN